MTVYHGKLARKAWMVAPETLAVMAALGDSGKEPRFVGGCVRDALANRNVVDIDIATPLLPQEVMAHLAAAKIKCVPTGLSHGTVTAIVDGKPFEVTTLRVDVNPLGRHAEVEFTDDWRADAARRDFTINAMSANLEGDVFDPFGGIEDLRMGRIVFVGDPDKRIEEDVLRILRFFRFFAHFGQGLPDAAALKACAKQAGKIARLSVERIRQETFRLLESDRCAIVWDLMLRTGVLTHFLPEATNIKALDRLLTLEHDHHSHAFVLRRLAAALDVPPAGVENLVQGLKLSNEQADQLLTMIEPPMDVTTRMTESAVRRLVYTLGNDMARSLLLLAAAKTGENGNLDALYNVATAFRAPRLPVVGDDLIKLGWPQGPALGQTLHALEDWWIAKDFAPGRTECLEKLKAEAASRRATPA